ncbi:MAG: dihydrofolate reductase [Ignavibacteriaceae bacterium]
MKLIIIAAIAKNGVIGANGSIPWHSKEDFKHFKETTLGFPVLMGLKTYESLGRPLPGRLNIVLSNLLTVPSEGENPIYFGEMEYALQFCKDKAFEKVFIIGGGSIYKQTIEFADEMVLSFMDLLVEGDVHFPEIDEMVWVKVKDVDKGEFIVKYFERVRK